MNKKKIFKGCLMVYLGVTAITLILGILLYFINPEMFKEETSTTTLENTTISESSEDTSLEIQTNSSIGSCLTKEEILERDKNVLNLKNNLLKIFEDVNQIVAVSKNDNKKGSDEDIKKLDDYSKEVFKLMGDVSVGTSNYAIFLSVDIGNDIVDIIKSGKGFITTLDGKYITQYDNLCKKIEENFSEVVSKRKEYFLENGFTEEEIPAFE